MHSNIVLSRQWPRVTYLCRTLTALNAQNLPQTSKSSDGISPPPRKPRGPTDILQALATTVGPDPTAVHYKYHDDPFLIPSSNFHKRTYALAAEAGRKAALWIRDEHAELFTTREWDPPNKMKTPYFNADPPIEAFAPKAIYNDESKVTEKDLKFTIENALLNDSVKIFQLLGGVDGVNNDLKLEFLQLLCFYNEKEPESMDWYEERWFSAQTDERQRVTWKLGGLAETIFTSLENKTPEAYCAIIQGMAKYFQVERAQTLTKEALEKGIPLSTGVYNSLIQCIGYLHDGTALRIEAMKNLLKQMNEQGLYPNLETLSCCLLSMSRWGSDKTLRDLALQIVAEFRHLGINPGLSAYYYLLCIFCKERGPRIDILSPIINDLEQRENLDSEDSADTKFFVTAMGICSNHLQDVNMAERLHALLLKGNNYKLVGDAFRESIYYRHYVTVACKHAPLEKAMELLDTLVPNIYSPEPSVMETIVKTLEAAGAGDRLAQAWSQIVILGHSNRVNLVENLVEAMINCYEYQEEDVKTKMRNAAIDILNSQQVDENETEDAKQRRTPKKMLSATAMCNILDLCTDTGAGGAGGEAAWRGAGAALERLRRDGAWDPPRAPRPLARLAPRAAASGEFSVATAAVTYLAECGFQEAMPTSVQVLSVILNRPEQEIEELLQQKQSTLTSSLHPSAVAVLGAYNLAKSSTSFVPESGSRSSSSDSDSESSSDDE